MKTITCALMNDEAGFIVSAELVLISSVAVLAMVVGLSEVAHGINQELEDVASAFGAINQSYDVCGQRGHIGEVSGSANTDYEDFCDSADDIHLIPADPEGYDYY